MKRLRHCVLFAVLVGRVSFAHSCDQALLSLDVENFARSLAAEEVRGLYGVAVYTPMIGEPVVIQVQNASDHETYVVRVPLITSAMSRSTDFPRLLYTIRKSRPSGDLSQVFAPAEAARSEGPAPAGLDIAAPDIAAPDAAVPDVVSAPTPQPSKNEVNFIISVGEETGVADFDKSVLEPFLKQKFSSVRANIGKALLEEIGVIIVSTSGDSGITLEAMLELRTIAQGLGHSVTIELGREVRPL